MDKAVDVSAYFYGVKEDVSTDYRDLALFLGITDTRNIESRNTDATSCCLDVLQTWKRTKGHQATVEVLLQALTSAKLESAADNLRMNLGKGDYPTPPPDQINITLSETPENETRENAGTENGSFSCRIMNWLHISCICSDKVWLCIICAICIPCAIYLHVFVWPSLYVVVIIIIVGAIIIIYKSKCSPITYGVRKSSGVWIPDDLQVCITGAVVGSIANLYGVDFILYIYYTFKIYNCMSTSGFSIPSLRNKSRGVSVVYTSSPIQGRYIPDGSGWQLRSRRPRESVLRERKAADGE